MRARPKTLSGVRRVASRNASYQMFNMVATTHPLARHVVSLMLREDRCRRSSRIELPAKFPHKRIPRLPKGGYLNRARLLAFLILLDIWNRAMPVKPYRRPTVPENIDSRSTNNDDRQRSRGHRLYTHITDLLSRTSWVYISERCSIAYLQRDATTPYTFDLVKNLAGEILIRSVDASHV